MKVFVLTLIAVASFFFSAALTAAVEIYNTPGNVIAETKNELLNRQKVNEIGYTDVLFDHTIDPRSEGFTAPQNDTLYASAWFDLTEEPIAIIQGRIDHGRYWVHELVTTENEVTNYIGAITDGYDGGVFLLAGPNYSDGQPEGVDRVIKVKTYEIWDLYRIYIENSDDYEAADSQRRGIRILTLSEYLKK